MTAPDSVAPEVAPDLSGKSDGSAPVVDSDIERGTVPAGPAHKGWLAAAIGLSLALHVGIAALFFLTPAGETLSRAIAGARSTGLAAAGDAAANKIAGSAAATGETAVAVTLVQPSAKPPTPPQPTQQQPQVQPRPRPKPATPAEDRKAPAAPSQQILTADTAGPQGTAPPVAAEPDAPPPPPAIVPTPTPRPTPPKNEERQTATRSEPSPRGGQVAARRGAAGGTEAGRQASTSQGRSDSGSGNAAASNYPGKIAGKLNRSLRYPDEAARRGLKGEAKIQFVIQASGAVGEVRVITTSGSDILDQAAIDTVKRAAPFPPIPAAADRKDWPFIVTLAFGK